MTHTLSDNQVRFLRLHAQRLVAPSANDVAHLVKELCGIQAQDARAAELAVRVRSMGVVVADVERARVQERSIICTWGQRGTLHLLAAEDVGWLDEFPMQFPIVRLLPGFDTYLLGYRSRNLVVSPRYARRINAGGGMITPTLVIDGRAAGTWKLTRQKNSLDVVLEPFDELAAEIQPALEAEVQGIGRFLGVPARLQKVSLRFA